MAILKRLKSFLRWLKTGEPFWPLHECPQPPTEADVIEKQSAFMLANALQEKLENCPAHGTKHQMKSALDQLYRAGSDWLYPSHIESQAAKRGNK